ncbi:hypothetical protein ACFLUT_02025 [Chloroflexota bacterium]
MGRLLRQKRRQLFLSERFVIYVITTGGYRDGFVAPPVEGLEVHVLQSEQDVEYLVAAGYEDVRRVMRPAGHQLRSGAIGFCAFVKRDVAHIAWVATTADAKLAIDSVPYLVGFADGEACWGGAYTVGRFRGKGLHGHVMEWRLRYCDEHGYRVVVGATNVDNAPSLRNQAKYGPRVRAQGRYRRVLRWSSWTEECQEDV